MQKMPFSKKNMTNPAITIHSIRSPRLRGYRTFWLKTVLGFDATAYGARCLRGGYHPQVWHDMACGTRAEIENMAEGDVGYLCGTVSDSIDRRDLHVAFAVEAGASISVRAYTGDLINLANARRIPIDMTASMADQYPSQTPAQAACVAWRFGAQHFWPA